MQLDGPQIVYPRDVQIVQSPNANTPAPPMPLRDKSFPYFSTKHDADEIQKLATAAVNAECIVRDGPGENLDTWYGVGIPSGEFIYYNTDGPRPYVISCPSKGVVDQSIGQTLIAKWTGQQALTLGKDSAGKPAFVWFQ